MVAVDEACLCLQYDLRGPGGYVVGVLLADRNLGTAAGERIDLALVCLEVVLYREGRLVPGRIRGSPVF
jgi:hypothetical protein